MSSPICDAEHRRKRHRRDGRCRGGARSQRRRRGGRTAAQAARVIRLAAGRQYLRLAEPVFLLDAAGDAELVLRPLMSAALSAGELLEMADAERVELALHGAVDTADAREVVARTTCRRGSRQRRRLGRLSGRRRHRGCGRRQRCGLGELRHRQSAVDAARVVGFAAGRQDLRLSEPVLLLDTTFERQACIEAFDVRRRQSSDVGEAADTEPP